MFLAIKFTFSFINLSKIQIFIPKSAIEWSIPLKYLLVFDGRTPAYEGAAAVGGGVFPLLQIYRPLPPLATSNYFYYNCITDICIFYNIWYYSHYGRFIGLILLCYLLLLIVLLLLVGLLYIISINIIVIYHVWYNEIILFPGTKYISASPSSATYYSNV